MGKAGVIPYERAKSMAIGTAAQFDLLAHPPQGRNE
jgi:hypothetical protein